MDKRFWVGALALCAGFGPGGTLAASAQQSSTQLADCYNEFGFRLLRRVAADRKNASVCVSPYSVATALALGYNGASGGTRQEIAQVLGINSLSPAQFNASNRELSAILAKNDSKTRVSIANGVWLNQSATIKPNFVNSVQRFYAARAQKANFAAPSTLQSINDFVRTRTAGKIPSILNNLDSRGVAVMVNAVYFKSHWLAKFDPAKTRSGQFFAPVGPKNVKFMEQSGDFHYVETPQAQVLTLPYAGGNYAMTLVLPKKISADVLLNTLNMTTWRQWTQLQMPQTGTVKLPKMKISTVADLEDSLPALGMKSAFSAQKADFSNLTLEKPVWISQVKHKTFVEVDESGTEAAAATGMSMKRGPAPTPFTFIANRPFIMAIQEGKSGAILFLGRVSMP